MFYTLKKLSLTFVFLNIFMIQSLMADMIFYYSAAVLPSIVVSQQNAHTEPIANHDHIEKSIIEPATVDVLENDIIGDDVTPIVRLVNYDNGQPEPTYVTQIETYEGIWSVEENQSVTFIPHTTFGGGHLHMEYQLSDEQGQTSQTGVEIVYPAIIRAEYDENTTSLMDPVMIDVLHNDTIPDGPISILLEESQNVYVDRVEHYEGVWLVVDGKVTFTPSEDFSGGTVQIWYQITDQDGLRSKNWINLNYPITVQAVHDEVSPATIAPVTMEVLANDMIAEGSTVTVSLEIYGENGPEYLPFVETFDGNWSVEANQSVTFTPNVNFGGGDVWISYQIEDQDGHTSKVDIGIRYPIYIYAKEDQVQKDVIEQVGVDVLDNDSITGTLETLLLENYNNGEVEYSTNVNGYGGTWIVDGPTVMFIPEENFGGGNVGIWYQITDDQGHVSKNWISIEFPMYVQANYDYILAPAVEAVTLNVLANDIVGEGITPSVLLEYYTDDGQIVYVEEVVHDYGTWIVVDGNVTFTPNENFGDRYTHIGYQLLDDNGHISKAGITIEYPVEIYAEWDHVQKDVIETVNVDVLANDTNLSAVTVLLEVYGSNGKEYVSSVEAFDGNWSVEADQSVTFAPNANFGGGNVWMWYQITDQEGRTSTSEIRIEYPVFVYAEWDQVQTDIIEPVIVDVLANDTNASEITIIELVNQNYETGSEEIGSTITTHQGEWSIVGNEVLFEPNDEFGGGSVYMQYQIADEAGHMSRSSIEIKYPIGPSPVCEVTELTTVASVHDAIASNISFDYNYGRREFGAELDLDSYTIDPALYGSSEAVTGFNPMFMVWYEEETRTTSTGDTFIRAEVETTPITLNSSDGTWSYEEQESGNDRGYKYVGVGGESGTYVVENDSSNTLSLGGDAVFSFKTVGEISEADIGSILENAGITLDLESGDTAQLQLTKELENDYDWWGSVDNNSYGSLNGFISANEYNSSETQFNNNGVLRTLTWQKLIIFAEGSEGQSSGTLIEIDRTSNLILADNAGTWHIENITDDEGTYDIIVAEPILCGYDKRIFKLGQDNGEIIQGEKENEAGIIGAELGFSSSLKDKLAAYFISEAPLDIDPDNPNSPEITEDMIENKVFYVEEYHEDNAKLFKEITIDSDNSWYTRREIYVDGGGSIIDDVTYASSYELDNGRIRLHNRLNINYGLISEPGDGDWEIMIYTWDWMGSTTWLLNKPADFPE